MRQFIITLCICSVTMSALALFYMLLSPALAKRYSAKGRYYAWLIIVAGLIIPFRPRFNHAILNVEIPPNTAAPLIPPNIQVPSLPLNNPVPIPPSLQISWWQVALLVWLAGMLTFLIYHTVKHVRFIKMVNRWSEPVTEEETCILFDDLKSQLGISAAIKLQICTIIGSPTMIGFMAPRILLPPAALSKSQLQFVLRHELIHYKRKDLWYKALLLIANAIHWFNPIIYLMTKAIQILCEISCDNEVIRHTGAEIRQHYSETILGIIKYQSVLQTSLSTNFYGSKANMKKRILSIMDMGRKKAGVILIGVILLITLGTGFALRANTRTTPPGASPESMKPSSQAYSYSQAGYHQKDYIFELGWNLSPEAEAAYTNKVQLTLSDHSDITISFDPSCKDYGRDEKAMSALTSLLDQLKKEYQNSELPLKTPIVTNVTYMGDHDIKKLAEEYYSKNESTFFSAIFSELDEETQKGYCDRMIGENKIAFFSTNLKSMDADLINFCAEAAYNQRNIAFFATMVPYLTDSSKQKWIGRASQEGKNNFLSVLTQQPAAEEAEYVLWNIKQTNGIYYYKDLRIRIFLDMRADNSFRKAFTDKAGTIDIRLIRDQNGNITKLELIGKEEAETLMNEFYNANSHSSSYGIYETYGLTYNPNKNKLYYKGQTVRYFIDKYNNGQGVVTLWDCDFTGTIDLYAVRSDTGPQGELMGIEAYSQKEFDLRTEEIKARQNENPDYAITAFRFTKEESPESLKLWIRECERDVFDFYTTEQNGRYYIFVRGETEFAYQVTSSGNTANMDIVGITSIQGSGYALFSVPLYEKFTVSYNGETRIFRR